MDEGGIFNTIFREKPALMLVELWKNNGDYASSLAKKVDCTYSHVVSILQKLEEAKIIVLEKEGRLKRLRLTDTGQGIAERVARVRNML